MTLPLKLKAAIPTKFWNNVNEILSSDIPEKFNKEIHYRFKFLLNNNYLHPDFVSFLRYLFKDFRPTRHIFWILKFPFVYSDLESHIKLFLNLLHEERKKFISSLLFQWHFPYFYCPEQKRNFIKFPCDTSNLFLNFNFSVNDADENNLKNILFFELLKENNNISVKTICSSIPNLHCLAIFCELNFSHFALQKSQEQASLFQAEFLLALDIYPNYCLCKECQGIFSYSVQDLLNYMRYIGDKTVINSYACYKKIVIF